MKVAVFDPRKLLDKDNLIFLGIALFMMALWAALYELGVKYRQGTLIALLTPTALIACLIAHGIATASRSSRVRLIHSLAFAWHMIVTVALSVFFVVDRAGALFGLSSNFLVEVAELGQTFYSALFGLGIAISLTAVVAARATLIELSDSGASAIAGFATNFAIVLAIATSSIHLYNFGVNIAKLSVIETLSATIMADIAFLAIKANIQTQIDARQKQGRYDFFDLVVWSVFGVVVAVYLILINGFTVAESSGIAQDVAMRAFIVRAYGMSPTILLLGLAALTILTKTVDYSSVRAGRGQPNALPRPNNPPIPRQFQNNFAEVNGKRESFRDED